MSIKNQKPDIHLFYIHSSIVYNISISIIKHLSLNMNNCRFLFCRNFSIEGENVKHILLPTIIEALKARYNFFKTRKSLSNFDNDIYNLVEGQEFILYVPHLVSNAMKALSTNLLCKRVSFIEEGLLSYMEKEIIHDRAHKKKKSVIRSLYFFLNFGKRIPRNKEAFPSEFLKNSDFYCFFDEAFTFTENKTVLKFIKDTNSSHSVSDLLILEPIIEVYPFLEEEYLNTISFTISKLIEMGINHFHYKYHPLQKKSIGQIEKIISDFKPEIQVTKIENKINLENLVLTSNCTLYLTVSSLSLYAILNGNKCYTNYYYMLAQENNTRKINFDLIPNHIKSQIYDLRFYS